MTISIETQEWYRRINRFPFWINTEINNKVRIAIWGRLKVDIASFIGWFSFGIHIFWEKWNVRQDDENIQKNSGQTIFKNSRIS